MIEYRLSTNIGNVSELSTRLKHGLNRLRVETINDVLLVEISSVSSLPYIGRRCIDELIAFKERYDFLLKKDKCNDNKEEQEFE